MVALTTFAARALLRPRLKTTYSALTSIAAVGVFLFGLDHLTSAVNVPAFWLMTALALLAASLAFASVDARGAAMVLCPVLAFSFAILLCWGLGPAILVQTMATATVGLRLRKGFDAIRSVATWYALAMGAAYGVLAIHHPQPFGATSISGHIADAAFIVLAAAAWLAVYLAQVVIDIRLSDDTVRWRRVRDWLAPQTLFLGALLLLSPVLAVAVQTNLALVLLIMLPIYAVQKMARLSAEKDLTAWSDPLTGLANRRGLQRAYSDMITSPHRAGAQLGMLMLDLDRFKLVNDALGHEVGDRLLVAVSQRLKEHTPPGGAAGRLGGDEFAMLLPELHDTGQGQQIAADVVAALARPVSLDNLDIDITASAGVAMQPYQGADFAALMRQADVALYDAKRSGDTAAAYNPSTDRTSPRRLTLLTDLRSALTDRDDTQITMHYQPQTAVETGDPVGVEALLRWTHPTRGPIPAWEVLQIAEHTAVMHLLTTRVIEQVTAQMAAWQRAGVTLRTSLNISARDLYSGDVAAQLAERLTHHKLSADQLQMEITESALMTDPTRAHQTITKISSMGVAVALDDFGTGYSSLQHLRRLPLTEVKIDRSFVAGMTHNPDDHAIVRSTIDLANALGLRTVAEGVEDDTTWRALTDAGCSLAQGWYIARPMPGSQLVPWLASRTATGSGHATVGAASAPSPERLGLLT